MKNNNQVILLLPMITLLMFVCIFAANRSSKTNEVTETVVTETIADDIQESFELKTIVTTETETTTESTTETETITFTETTTENYPEIYTEKPNGMVFYNEQGDHTTSLGRFYITGYTAEEGFLEGSATASGVGCRPGICAMNDRQRKELGIKYGDSIYIDGLGTYQVQDCGCAYGVIDIWFRTNATAYYYTGYYDVYI